jgi:MOSC domain-containing protein YiiM
MPGVILGIYRAVSGGAAMESLDRVSAIAGQGLEGDRYAAGTGFYSPLPTTPGARELTLIEQEALDAIREEAGLPLSDGEVRRNLVTRGVRLGDLMGTRFTIGEIVCEGARGCPPCAHLEELTGKPLLPLLARTGGLRARIVTGGTIRIGDEIVIIGPAEGPVHGEDQS